VSEGKNRVEPLETAEFRHGFRHASTAIPSLDMIMRAISDSRCRPEAAIRTFRNRPFSFVLANPVPSGRRASAAGERSG
jgi:hypothetical protein